MSTPSRGIWSSYRDPALARDLAALGYDWLCVDMQHGLHDDRSMVDCVAALLPAGTPAWVRVARNDPALIGRALDAGATTVVIPLVESAEQAAAAAAATRYPPRGARSFGPFAGAYGTAPDTSAADALVRCAVMIETPLGLERVREIVRTEGVDAIFIGPFDLALGLGIGVDEAIAGPVAEIVREAHAAGREVAAFAGSEERARRLAAQGVDAIAVATDRGLLAAGAAGAQAL